MRGLLIDLFAGGGGASEGLKEAFGFDPDHAVNHDREAISMHKANHPGTLHHCQDVWAVPPRWVTRGRPVDFLWASPDCTHHSKAKGGKPNRDAKRRDLAWVVVKWAREVWPLVIALENVEEFKDWGPCDKNGIPIKSQIGASFRSFVATLRRLGYQVDWRELRARDYGTPTIRKRLFLMARRDGLPIVWPGPTHGHPESKEVLSGQLKPWRTAAECIDFSQPCPSIFDRKRPLAENTRHRIAEGVRRFVQLAAEPFIVRFNTGSVGHSLSEPMRTVTAGGHPKRPSTGTDMGLVSPYLVGIDQKGARSAKWGVDNPLSTVMTKAKHALVAPYLIPRYGERAGQAPRSRSVQEPLPTVVTTDNGAQLVSPILIHNTSGHAPADVRSPLATQTTGNHAYVATAFLAKHYGGVVGHPVDRPIGAVTTTDHHSLVIAHLQRDFGNSVGSPLDAPVGTITAGGGGKTGLVASHLVKLRGTCRAGQDERDPMPTITAGGQHVGEVRTAFMLKYYGEGGQWQSPADPMHTIPTKDRMGLVECRFGFRADAVKELLRWHRQSKPWGFRGDDFFGLIEDAFAGEVVLHGEVYTIADIGLRMLNPRELYTAQGFSENYIIDHGSDGEVFSKTSKVRMCGNSVCPQMAAVLARANRPATSHQDLTAGLPLFALGDSR